MSKKLVIAQVTDTHIGADATLYRGVDVRQQFLNVLQILSNKPLDLLVLTGDLAATKGELEAYQWIKGVLSGFPCPYVVSAGNHDNVENMINTFHLSHKNMSNGSFYFSYTVQDRKLFFLDSSLLYITLQQLNWLQVQATQSNEQALLFLHHPPLLCDCQFMDKYYPLQNIDEVWRTLTQLTSIQHIFCGHYHTEKTLFKAGKHIYLTPSTMLQIDNDNPSFTVAHKRPGWRLIEWDSSYVNTYVEYLE